MTDSTRESFAVTGYIEMITSCKLETKDTGTGDRMIPAYRFEKRNFQMSDKWIKLIYIILIYQSQKINQYVISLKWTLM